MTETAAVGDAVERAHRRHWAEVLAAVVGLTRDLDLAEECTQEAYVAALRSWSAALPDNPAAWLTTTARRVALDRLRREATLRRKLPLLIVDAGPTGANADPADSGDDSPTDLLRLVFTCCHPALSQPAQVALTLRLLCGLTTAEVAAALLVKEATAAARITRAKHKIAAAGIPFRVPDDGELPQRLDAVLTVIHLAYTAGHTAQGGGLVRPDLTVRAIGLARMLAGILPEESEVQGLLAMLLLTQARGDARIGPDGELVLLRDQDRGQWDQAMIRDGLRRATVALRLGDGRFALQAAIAGLHATAGSWDGTDWPQVVRMYDGLLRCWPSPVVAANRAVARSFVAGADLTGVLAELDDLVAGPGLKDYPYLHAARADVLARLGRTEPARHAYDEAILVARNDVERRFLSRRRDDLEH